MTQSLNNRKKAKKRSNKQAQQQAQAIRDTKQDKDRERFWKQAKAEKAAAYSNSTLSSTNKAIHLEKEQEATKQQGDKFAKWQMESEMHEQIRAQTAATAVKKLSPKVKEREYSRPRLEVDRVTSQENRQQKQQQQHPVPSQQRQESQLKTTTQ